MPSRNEPSITMPKSDDSQLVDKEKKVGTGETILGPVNVNFLGTGREYFGIWIVNLILTINF